MQPFRPLQEYAGAHHACQIIAFCAGQNTYHHLCLSLEYRFGHGDRDSGETAEVYGSK